MTRKSIINSINQFIYMNGLKWVEHNHFQRNNPEQTTMTSYRVQEDDYVLQDFEYEIDAPDFSAFTKEQLIFMFDRVQNELGEVFAISIDSFGDLADVPYFYIEGMGGGFWYYDYSLVEHEVQPWITELLAQDVLENPENYGLI